MAGSLVNSTMSMSEDMVAVVRAQEPTTTWVAVPLSHDVCLDRDSGREA